ncbi:Lipase 5 [Rhizina undulata]
MSVRITQDGQLRKKKSFGSRSGSSRKTEELVSEGPLAPLFKLIKHPTYLLPGLVLGIDEKARRKQLVAARLENAATYAEWHKAAVELDELEGNEAWKSDPRSPDYDWRLVESRLKQLNEARLSCDVGKMLFLIRTTLTRNLGDMGNICLYKHSRTGTKHLIEEYINACLSTLEAILTAPSSTASSPSSGEILESLIATRQSFGRTALLLSGGATFGMSHIGVIKALLQASLLPRIISGASAGSIVASVLCTRTDDEIPPLLKEFAYGDLDVFEDGNKPETLFERIARFLKIGAWIDAKHLKRVMIALLGDITFQEAYNRTRRILNICVSSASVYETPRLLNYITSPNVLIWSAVAASCSVPFLFTPSAILAKDPKTGLPVPWNPSPQRWIDGSVENDLPMTRLAELFNVNHFIVSQVNPHVVPFLSEQTSTSASSSTPSWSETIVKLALGEALHRMNVVAEIGVFRTGMTKLRSVLSQRYSGDITILPEVSIRDFPRILKNPDSEFMLDATKKGERATWPKMARVANHCRIELKLDEAIYELRTRVVFSPSMSELRLGLSGWRGRRIRRRGSSFSRGVRTVSAGWERIYIKKDDGITSSSSSSSSSSSPSSTPSPSSDGEEALEDEEVIKFCRRRRPSEMVLCPPDKGFFSSTSQPGTPGAWALVMTQGSKAAMEGRGEGGGFVF